MPKPLPLGEAHERRTDFSLCQAAVCFLANEVALVALHLYLFISFSSSFYTDHLPPYRLAGTAVVPSFYQHPQIFGWAKFRLIFLRSRL